MTCAACCLGTADQNYNLAGVYPSTTWAAYAEYRAPSQEQQQHQQPATEALSTLQLGEGGGGSAAQVAGLQMPPPPSDVMPAAAAAIGAPPAATPTITIVSGNQLRVQPATWAASGGGGSSGSGGQTAGRQSPSVEPGYFAGAEGGVAPLPPPAQLPAAATTGPTPFRAPGAGFGEDPAESQLLRRPSYGTQVRRCVLGVLRSKPAAMHPVAAHASRLALCLWSCEREPATVFRGFAEHHNALIKVILVGFDRRTCLLSRPAFSPAVVCVAKVSTGGAMNFYSAPSMDQQQHQQQQQHHGRAPVTTYSTPFQRQGSGATMPPFSQPVPGAPSEPLVR